jgi:nucleoside-diphosphate-sugar epimerase
LDFFFDIKSFIIFIFDTTVFCFFTVQFIIGDGNNLYDFTYVENVAHAHVCAERALASGGDVSTKAAGQVFAFS